LVVWLFGCLVVWKMMGFLCYHKIKSFENHNPTVDDN